MVVARDLGGHGQELPPAVVPGSPFQRLGADHDVLLHQLELARHQPARLQENRIGDAYLADVVKRTGTIQVRQELFIDLVRIDSVLTEPVGENLRISADSHEVLACVRVARFGQLSQREDRHVLSRDDLGCPLFDKPLQLGIVELNLLVGRPRVGVVPRGAETGSVPWKATRHGCTA